MTPMDSGYTGGVFYLSTNDLVGVRPISESGRAMSFVGNQGAYAYFGMFLLSADNGAGLERPRNCIDEI